jgi:hypothetical protein
MFMSANGERLQIDQDHSESSETVNLLVDKEAEKRSLWLVKGIVVVVGRKRIECRAKQPAR